MVNWKPKVPSSLHCALTAEANFTVERGFDHSYIFLTFMVRSPESVETLLTTAPVLMIPHVEKALAALREAAGQNEEPVDKEGQS